MQDFFAAQIKQYKIQDKEHGFKTNEESCVNSSWLMSCVKKCCFHCGATLSIDIADKQVNSNISADRIDNLMGHNLNNIFMSCVACNCARGNRN